MLHIRPACWPQDVSALSALGTSFVTDTVYRLSQDELSFRFVEEIIKPPLCKRYPFDPSGPEAWADWDHAVAAEVDGRLVGFAAAQYTAWNCRVVLWHLYVAPAHRGQGLGTRLLESVEGFARGAAARSLWLETQNVNSPAVRFYLRAGFMLCGLDTDLYNPDGLAPGEVALFMARPVANRTEESSHSRD